MRPDHGRLAGVPLAAIMPANFYKALLPRDLDAIVAYLLRSSQFETKSRSGPYKAPVRRDAYPDADAGFDKRSSPLPPGAAPISPPSAIAWNATPPGRAAFPTSRMDWAAAAGFSRRPRERRQDRPDSIAANITSHPTAGLGGWTDAEIGRAITHGVGRDGHPLKPPMAYAFYAGLEAGRSDRYHRLSAHGAAAAMKPS